MQRLAAKMTPAEFLTWEREQPTRHHYLRGEIFDMAGGSIRHNALGIEIGSIFASSLKNASCRTFSADQKIGIGENVFVYADCSVACAPIEARPGATDVLINPVVVVEILSKSTESYDRSDKLHDYLALASVRHVLLVAQRAPRIDVYSRDDKGDIKYETFGAGAAIEVTHPRVALSVDALYAGVFDLPGDE